MDNREFAELLLCEATNILTESTREDRENYKKDPKTSSKYWGDRSAKHHAIAMKKTEESADAREAAENTKWYQKKRKNDLIKKADEADDEAGYNWSNSNHTSHMGRRVAAARKAELKGRLEGRADTNKSTALHRKINAKVNQECADLAILLTEAALLLNDED